MHVGGAQFEVGVTHNEIEDDKDPTFALKILIFEVDARETVDRIFEDIADILIHIDPDLDLKKTEGRVSDVN